MELSWTQLFAAEFLVFLGSLAQSTLGFGLAVVAAPLLFLIDPDFVPGPIIFIAVVVSILIAYRSRQSIQLWPMRYAFVMRVPGSVLGLFLLVLINQQLMSVLLGASVLIAVLVNLTRYEFKMTSFSLGVAGFFSGIMGTASSVGGPPMALVMMSQKGDSIRANLSCFYTFSSLVSLALLHCQGFFTLEQFYLALMVLPAMLLGYFAAGKIIHRLNAKTLQVSTLLLCLLSGSSAIGVALYHLL